MRKAMAFCLTVCLLLFGSIQAFAKAALVETRSQGSILMEAGTGQILSEKNADVQMPAAGCAKLMVLLLVFDAVNQGNLTLTEEIQVSDTAAAMGGTQAFLEPNASYKVEDLLRGLCVASANDAAVAFGEKLFGSKEEMTKKMNEKAAALGCTKTLFADPVGLDDKTVTSAKDLALIARALCAFPNVFRYTSVYQDNLAHPTGRITELVNANRMVRFYNGCDGLVTGSSAKARYGVVSTVKKGDMRLIAVALGSEDTGTRFEDAKLLLDYGFATYVSKVVVRQGETVKKELKIEGGTPQTIDVIAGEDVRLVLQKGEEKNIEKSLALHDNLQAPLTKGQEIGKINISVNGVLYYAAPALSGGDITQLSFKECLKRIARWWVH